MMANNWQRLNIWLSAKKTFDYVSFKEACNAQGCEPQGALEFAQKAGMVMCGVTAYPELPVAEAYLKFIENNQTAYTPPIHQHNMVQDLSKVEMEDMTVTYANGRVEIHQIPKSAGSGCSSCGGGRVV